MAEENMENQNLSEKKTEQLEKRKQQFPLNLLSIRRYR